MNCDSALPGRRGIPRKPGSGGRGRLPHGIQVPLPCLVQVRVTLPGACDLVHALTRKRALCFTVSLSLSLFFSLSLSLSLYFSLYISLSRLIYLSLSFTLALALSFSGAASLS